MINLELPPKQLDELYAELSSNDTASARKKCLIVYLSAKGYSRDVVADIARVDPDTVTNQVKKYAKGGLQNLLKNNYRSPKSQLQPYAGELKALFEKKSPTQSTKQ